MRVLRIAAAGALMLGAAAGPCEKQGFETQIERFAITGDAPFLDEFDDGARSAGPTAHFIDRGATELAEQDGALILTALDGADRTLGADLTLLDRPLRNTDAPASVLVALRPLFALRADQQTGLGAFWSASTGEPAGPALLYVTRRSGAAVALPFAARAGAPVGEVTRVRDRVNPFGSPVELTVGFIASVATGDLALPGCGTDGELVIVATDGAHSACSALPESSLAGTLILRWDLDGEGLHPAYSLDAGATFASGNAWDLPAPAAELVLPVGPVHAGVFAGGSLPESALSFDYEGLAAPSDLTRDGQGALLAIEGALFPAGYATLGAAPGDGPGSFRILSADGRDLRLAPGALELQTPGGILRGIATCLLGTEPACTQGGNAGPDNVLGNISFNQPLYGFVCSGSIGFTSLDRSVCAPSILNSLASPFPRPTLTMLTSQLLAGSATGIAFGANAAFLGANGASSRIPLVALSIDAGDGVPTGFFSAQLMQNFANTAADPAVLNHHNNQTLAQVLTVQQQALLGCGPFYGTRCDGGVATYPDPNFLTPGVGGLYPLYSEVGALLQSWVGFEGTSEGSFLTTDGSRAQPGTVGYQAGPICTRVSGGQIVMLPGCREPSDPGYDPALDGPDPRVTNVGFPAGQGAVPTLGSTVLGPIAFTGGHPFTGQTWRSEMAALSWNLQMTLVAFSTNPDLSAAERFDPAAAYRIGACSYNEPQRCSAVRAFHGAVGDTLPDDPRGAFARRWLWEMGAVYRITEATGVFASLKGGELTVPGPLSTSVAGAAARVPILVASATLADADRDGVLDGKDRCPTRADPFQEDADGDGVGEVCDVCILEHDPLQRDTDGDGIGNRCDPDFDGDGRVSFRDLATLRARLLTADADADLDGDGLVGLADLAIFKRFLFRAPGPAAPPTP